MIFTSNAILLPALIFGTKNMGHGISLSLGEKTVKKNLFYFLL